MIRRWISNCALLLGVASVTGSTAFGAITMNTFVADLQALPSFQVRVMTTDALGGSYPTAPLPGSPDYVNGEIKRNSGNGRGEFRIETANPAAGTAAWDEIHFTPSWANTPWVYETFCIERGEGIDTGDSQSDGFGTYYATLDAGAWYGTNADGSYASPDLLSADTKLLFALYADGRLDNVILSNAASNNNSYSYTSDSDAGLLQSIFWHLEDSLILSSGSTELAWLAVIQAWRTANAVDAAAYEAGVNVVNLWKIPVSGTPYPEKSLDKHKQSFLIFAPPQTEAPPVVPEPITLVIWSGMSGLGLAFGAYRRRGKCVTK